MLSLDSRFLNLTSHSPHWRWERVSSGTTFRYLQPAIFFYHHCFCLFLEVKQVKILFIRLDFTTLDLTRQLINKSFKILIRCVKPTELKPSRISLWHIFYTFALHFSLVSIVRKCYLDLLVFSRFTSRDSEWQEEVKSFCVEAFGVNYGPIIQSNVSQAMISSPKYLLSNSFIFFLLALIEHSYVHTNPCDYGCFWNLCLKWFCLYLYFRQPL